MLDDNDERVAPTGSGQVVAGDGTIVEVPVEQRGSEAVIEYDGTEMAIETGGDVELVDDRLVVSDGATVTTSGSGFMPGSIVEVWVFSTPTLLGTAEVDEDGSFSAVYNLPADLAVGVHTLQAEGVTSSGEPRAMALALELFPTAVELPVTGSTHSMDLVNLTLVLTALGGMLVLVRRRRQLL